MTRPDAKFRKRNVKIIGMSIMILFCAGSRDVGVIFCWMTIVIPMTIGSGPTANPPISGKRSRDMTEQGIRR